MTGPSDAASSTPLDVAVAPAGARRGQASWPAAAVVALFAFAASPWGIMLVSGRQDLSYRINLVGTGVAAFLVVLSGALATSGRVRRLFFFLLAMVLPVVLLCGLEVTAIALHFADHVSPIEDTSVVAYNDRWPSHMMDDARLTRRDGLQLYVPWHSDDIVLNDLGLRTRMPEPKRPGEWRIAVTGGSTAWGWRVRDADTVAEQLAAVLHAQGRVNVTVYNFGIEGADIAGELALLRHFRDTYAIDQAIFFTGGNDATFFYLQQHATGVSSSSVASLELVKLFYRIAALVHPSAPSPPVDVLRERVRRSNSLRDGIAAAGDYCRGVGLTCDFVLQPWLPSRRQPVGPEIVLRRTIDALYPGMHEAYDEMYDLALAAGPLGHVHDLRQALDDVAAPVYADVIHSNEIAYQALARQIAARVPVPALARAQ